MNKKFLTGLAVLAILLFGIALFIPEKSKSGEPRKLYSYKEADLKKLTYTGPMKISDSAPEIQVKYTIVPEAYPYKSGEYFWKIEIENFPSADNWPKEKKWHSALARYASLKSFYGLNLIRSVVQDFTALDFLFEVDAEPARDSQYGFDPCKAQLLLEFRKGTKSFCLGSSTQNNGKRYVREVTGNTYLMPDYIFRRLENNIFAQKNLLVSPYNPEDTSYIYLWPSRGFSGTMPETRSITKDKLAFQVRMHALPGEKERRVWYLENDLLVPPSHAAVISTELLRIETEFAEEIPSGCENVFKAESGRVSTDKEHQKLFTFEVCKAQNTYYLKSPYSSGRIKPASWQRIMANFKKLNDIVKENAVKMAREQKAPTPQTK